MGLTLVTGNKALYKTFSKVFEDVAKDHFVWPRKWETGFYPRGSFSLVIEGKGSGNLYGDAPETTPYCPEYGDDLVEPEAVPRIEARFRTPHYYSIEYHSQELMARLLRELAETEPFFVDIGDGRTYSETEFIAMLNNLPEDAYGYLTEEAE